VRAHGVVLVDERIKIALQLGQVLIKLLPESHPIELVQERLVEAFTDTIGLRALGLHARAIDVLDREMQLVRMPIRLAAGLSAPVRQHATDWNTVLVEKRQDAIVQ
jgi:hypothetical protein